MGKKNETKKNFFSRFFVNRREPDWWNYSVPGVFSMGGGELLFRMTGDTHSANVGFQK